MPMPEKQEEKTEQPRCPNCGCFCGMVYRSAGSAGQVPKRSCTNCGLRPPRCSHEDGSCYGCQNNATHIGATKPNKREKPWCPDHAPETADTYPYVEVEA